MKKIPVALLALAVALAVPAAAQNNSAAPRNVRNARAAGVLSLPIEEPGDSLYRLGREAITAGDYRRAANLLKQVADKYPQSKSAGEALYWRAWSLHRLGVDRHNSSDLKDALASIDRLEDLFPNYGAMGDVRSLRSTIRASQASLGDANAAGDVVRQAKGVSEQRSCPGSSADDEMRMAALDGLLSMSSEDAVPILMDVLKQRDPCRVEIRKKAVFLLSQKRSANIAATLLDVARSDPSSDVRGDAIFWLSQTRSEAAIPALDSILRQATDYDIRKKAIFALSQQSRDERARAALQRAAEDERYPEDLREEAVFWLGQSHIVDLDYFKSLFKKAHTTELKKKITFTVAQSSSPAATTWLTEIAKDKSNDVDVRKDAIFWLSQTHALDLAGLQTIYDGAKGEEEIQKQVIFVYSQRRESAAVDKLLEIAKSDPSVENRKQALFWLGQKNDPRVKQFLRDLIKG